MEMTVRQIAGELGVSRQKIYRYIDTHAPSAHYRGSGKTMYFDEAEIKKMKRFFGIEEETDTEQDSEKDSALLSRIRQLEEENSRLKEDLDKNEQRVRELLSQRAELLKALRSSNNCIRRLTISIRELTGNLWYSQRMYAQALSKQQKQSPRLSSAGIAKLMNSLVCRFTSRP